VREVSPAWVTRYHESLAKPIAAEVWTALVRGEIGWGKALAQHEKRTILEESLASWREYVRAKEGEGETSLDIAKKSWAKYYAEERAQEERERQVEQVARGEAIPVELAPLTIKVLSE